ncbi:MAG: T9SS type A sorting domain-containing protein, partial [Bacteroidetes bacterium]
YPNPFSDKINFVVTTSISGKGTLEVYNMMGQKIRTVYQGFISAGTQTFQMSSQKQQVANLIYVLRIGDKKVSGKILQINQ